MILLIIDLLQKFDYRVDETNIKRFLKSLQKLEEHQHQIFLEDLQKTLQFFEDKKKQQEQKLLNDLREKNSDR
ncbi:MAG: hypothetical protein K2P52_09385 [Campylobacterales bacterium]|nr:hypothetical protein [Campylobacterales bacterium]